MKTVHVICLAIALLFFSVCAIFLFAKEEAQKENECSGSEDSVACNEIRNSAMWVIDGKLLSGDEKIGVKTIYRRVFVGSEALRQPDSAHTLLISLYEFEVISQKNK